MNIEMKDTITLDGVDKYIVVSKVDYQNNIYYYLTESNNSGNVKFCMEKPNTNILVEVNDENLNKILLSLFVEKTKEIINGINFEEMN